MWGGPGADIYAFGPGGGSDRVLDFEDDVDRLNLRSLGFSGVEEALSHATDTAAGHVVFQFESGDRLTILDMTQSALGDDILV